MADYLDHIRRLCSGLFLIAVALVLVAINLPGSETGNRGPIYVVLGLAFLCHVVYRHLERTVEEAARAEAQQDLVGLRHKFVDQVSHELRTPLTSLILAGELLARGSFTAEQQAQYVGFVQASGKRLKQIVDELPGLARFDRREPRVERNPVRFPAPLSEGARAALPAWTKRSNHLSGERDSPR